MTRFFAFALFAFTTAVSAQTYPSRPITLVVPYTPGTGIDIIARTDLTRQISADVQRWKKFTAETGIKAD